MNKESGLPKLIDGFDAKHPKLGDVLFREFHSHGITTAPRVIYGALITGLLLEHVQQRIGGRNTGRD